MRAVSSLAVHGLAAAELVRAGALPPIVHLLGSGSIQTYVEVWCVCVCIVLIAKDCPTMLRYAHPSAAGPESAAAAAATLGAMALVQVPGGL
jgi:hypothetical protein